MFIHNFKYSFKTVFRNKMLVFWTFMFPIILGLFFNLAFSDIEKNEKLDVIDIAYVEEKENYVYKSSFEELSKGEDKLFNIKYVTEEKAKNLLEEDKISGYVVVGENADLFVKSSGINETVIKEVIDEISEMNEIYKNYDFKNPEDNVKFMNAIGAHFGERQDYTKDISKSNLSYTMIEFYTLIAMAALYGGVIGMVAVNQMLPNMSDKGKRVAISPVRKKTFILSSVLSSYLIQLIGLFLLFMFTIFVLKVDYGDNLFHVIGISLAGSLAGLSLGIAIASLVKSGEATKTGLIISISMAGSFLSGMMGITMKYVIDSNIPWLNKINPVNMITDGLYSLYYYDTFNRYYFNLISLIVFSSFLISLSILSLRRVKYDNI